MKKFLIVLLTLTAFSAHAFEPFLSVFGGDLDNGTQYTATKNVSGISVGFQNTITNTPVFYQLEMVATEANVNPSASIGVKAGDYSISAGIGSITEHAQYDFGSGYSNGNTASDFDTKLIEVTAYDFFARYTEYDASHNFVGTKKGSAPLTASVSNKNQLIQVGYRFKF